MYDICGPVEIFILAIFIFQVYAGTDSGNYIVTVKVPLFLLAPDDAVEPEIRIKYEDTEVARYFVPFKMIYIF